MGHEGAHRVKKENITSFHSALWVPHRSLSLVFAATLPFLAAPFSRKLRSPATSCSCASSCTRAGAHPSATAVGSTLLLALQIRRLVKQIWTTAVTPAASGLALGGASRTPLCLSSRLFTHVVGFPMKLREWSLIRHGEAQRWRLRG